MERNTSAQPVDPAGLFRCLIGDGASVPNAQRVAHASPETLASAFAAASRADGAAGRVVGVRIDTAHSAGDLGALIDRLQYLRQAQRHALLAHHVGGIAVDRLMAETNTLPADLLEAQALLAIGGGNVDAVLRPLIELQPPAMDERRVPASALGLLAACLVALVTVASIMPDRPPAAPVAAIADTPTTTMLAMQTEPPKSSSTGAPSTTAAPFQEPDREVEFLLRADGSVVRVEPWTMRVIWESKAFTSARIVSIDPNTVTIDSNGNRLILSQTDGTLLPP